MSERTLPAIRKANLPPVDRTRELNWLAEHRHEYLGQWIVLDGDRLLGHGPDPIPLVESARDAGNPRPLVIHVRNETEPATGGWL
ncbi:MAG: hypothetical protein ACR2G5_12280 [Pyrinomonadaceae bacterium]